MGHRSIWRRRPVAFRRIRTRNIKTWREKYYTISAICTPHQSSKGLRRYDRLTWTYQVTFCSYTVFPERAADVNSLWQLCNMLLISVFVNPLFVSAKTAHIDLSCCSFNTCILFLFEPAMILSQYDHRKDNDCLIIIIFFSKIDSLRPLEVVVKKFFHRHWVMSRIMRKIVCRPWQNKISQQ